MAHLTRPSVLLLCGVLLFLNGCGKKSEESAVKPAISVETSVAVTAPLLDEIAVTGSLAAKRSAEIKSELAGLYREVYVTEWVAVRKGQPLARIQAAETETQVKRAEAGALQAQVEVDRARREAERMRNLKSSGLATQQQLDDAESVRAAVAAQQSAAAEELAQLRLRLEKSVVRAPIDGVVALRTINVGDLSGVDAGGKIIFRIVDNRRLDLTVTIPSTELSKVAIGQPLIFSCDGFPGQEFRGTIQHLNPSINPIDRSLQVMAEVDNRDGRLRDGLFVKGRIVVGQRDQVLLVPRSVLSGLDLVAVKAILFVIEGEKAVRREVKTGALSGESVEIVSGLQPGERYVTRGSFSLRNGDRVSIATAPTAGR